MKYLIIGQCGLVACNLAQTIGQPGKEFANDMLVCFGYRLEFMLGKSAVVFASDHKNKKKR